MRVRRDLADPGGVQGAEKTAPNHARHEECSRLDQARLRRHTLPPLARETRMLRRLPLQKFAMPLAATAIIGACSVFVDSGQSSGGALDGGAEGGADASLLPPPALVDCADPVVSTDDRCRTVDTLQPGTIGGGVIIDWRSPLGNGNLRLDVVGGVVHGQELLMAVRRDDPTGEGGIVGVHLESGERRLISGSLGSPSGGMTSQGLGDGFVGLSGVGVSSSGNPFALLLPPFQGFSGFVLDIDSATGNRTTRSVGQKCEQVLPPSLQVQPTVRPAVLADSSFYTLGQNLQAEWIVRITGEQCELLDQAPLDAGVESITWHQGQLWFVDQFGSSLVSFDTTSGKSKLVSASAASKPAFEDNPIGSGDLAVGDSFVYGAGGELLNAFRLMEVNRLSGARRVLAKTIGPARSDPKTRQLVFVHPTRAALLLVIDGAVVVYDPANGNNNVLSF